MMGMGSIASKDSREEIDHGHEREEDLYDGRDRRADHGVERDRCRSEGGVRPGSS